MTQETALAEYNAEVLDSQPGIRQAFMLMLAEVPEPDGDAAANIVGAILGAQTIEDLDKPWDSEGMRDLAGQALTVHEIARRPSDYGKGLGVYLGCKVTVEAEGTTMFVTTGSVSIVAQLVRAYALKAFPIRVIPREAEKPTKDGYIPMHLEILRKGQSS